MVPSARLSGGHTWIWGGLFASLASVGLESLRPSPAGWKRWGRGHPALAGRGLMGPPQGVCRVRQSRLPAAPPWRGGSAELPRAGAGRAPRVRSEGWRGCGSRLGLIPCNPLLRPLGDWPKCGCRRRVRARQGCCWRSGAWSFFDSWQLRVLGFQGLVLRPILLFASCESRKPL